MPEAPADPAVAELVAEPDVPEPAAPADERAPDDAEVVPDPTEDEPPPRVGP